ncbi:hypothetical protein D3C87_1340560 [compost metagenome]
MAPRQTIHARGRPTEGRQSDGRVIHQATAYALAARPHGNRHLLQVVHRPDAGAQQMRRRVDGTARQDDLVPVELMFLSIDQGLHADTARAVKKQLRHMRAGQDFQVGASANIGIQIAHRSRNTALVLVVEGHRKIAFDELAVLVGQVGVAGIPAGIGEGVRQPRPVRTRDAADRYAALFAVQGAIAIQVALHLAEVRKHIAPSPTRSATCLPLAVVGGSAAIEQLAVDGGATAEHARLRVLAQRRPVGRVRTGPGRLSRHTQIRPVEVRVEEQPARVAVQQLGRFAARRRVDASFEQQDFVGAAGRKPVGQHGARRTATDNDSAVHRTHSSLMFAARTTSPHLRYSST